MIADKIRPLGRYDDSDPNVLRFAWSGSGFVVRFQGTRLRACVMGTNAWLNISLDGGADRPLEVLPGRDWIDLASGLGPGEHSVQVQKRTEPLVGELCLTDFETDGRILPADPACGLRIEFVGDSITCGYGNLAPSESSSFEPSTEDFARSFAGLIGDEWGADLHCVAWSGLGLVRNYDLEPSPTLIERYRYANPLTFKDWDFARWIPQVVVVNLGTNDFSRMPVPDSILFRNAMTEFIRQILHRSPKAKVVLVDGPLLKNGTPLDNDGRGFPSLSTVRSHLDLVVRQFLSHQVFRFSLTPARPDLGYGADWHPSSAQHRLNANELSAFLRSTVVCDLIS